MFSRPDINIKPGSRAVVNWTLIGICAIVLLYELTLSGLDRDIFFLKFGLIPYELIKRIDLRTLNHVYDIHSPISNWLTMFTSIFIHADFLHFAFNMLFLWAFGSYVEVRLGHIRYLLFFLAAGVAGSWLQIATNTDSRAPIIGASGAIAGVLALYLFFLPSYRLGSAILFIGFWFLIQFAGAVGSLGTSAQGESIAYWAHIGGFIFGIVIGFIHRHITRRKTMAGENDTIRYWRGRQL